MRHAAQVTFLFALCLTSVSSSCPNQIHSRPTPDEFCIWATCSAREHSYLKRSSKLIPNTGAHRKPPPLSRHPQPLPGAFDSLKRSLKQHGFELDVSTSLALGCSLDKCQKPGETALGQFCKPIHLRYSQRASGPHRNRHPVLLRLGGGRKLPKLAPTSIAAMGAGDSYFNQLTRILATRAMQQVRRSFGTNWAGARTWGGAGLQEFQGPLCGRVALHTIDPNGRCVLKMHPGALLQLGKSLSRRLRALRVGRPNLHALHLANPSLRGPGNSERMIARFGRLCWIG